MTKAVPGAPSLGRLARIRLKGAALLLLLALLAALQTPLHERLRAAGFDAFQQLTPRPVRSLSVTVVEIDHKSLLARGQWPWPRTLLAKLVQRINDAGPAAVGLNILMPESDALSPERLLGHAHINDATLDAALRALPSNDAELARALAASPSVLVVAGTDAVTGRSVRATPVLVSGGDALAAVAAYPGALTSIDELDNAAAGRGMISAERSRGVLRRIGLMANIGGTLMPALAVEMLRVGLQVPVLRLAMSGDAVAGITIGKLHFPTEADGAMRVYFSSHRADRFVSAVDVLDGRADLSALRGQLVLVGVTGTGLQELHDTPTGERLSGTEVHAQLIENLVDGTWLRRPPWAATAEALLLLGLGALLLWCVPRWRALYGLALLVGCVAALLLLSVALFRSQRLLFDASVPALSLIMLYGALLVLTLNEAANQRKTLEGVVQRQRERNAHDAGELAAAQRVQTATLPSPELLHGDARVDLHALLVAARHVGGDLYDFFMLDERRLFLLIGDVAGKGLPASIFMAVSKALCKSAMLREPDADIGAMMSQANREVSRDNAQMLFVTVFAAILDLDNGRLDYCNAGHDDPWRLHPGRPGAQRISDGDGPPLCALDGYDYRGASVQLQRGELLCLMTDGVTEAQNPAGELFGTERVQQRLLALNRSGTKTAAWVQALHDDVLAFANGAEAADDLTLLVLRWNGPVGNG